MGRIADYINEKYILVSGVGAGVVGTSTAVGLGSIGVWGSPLLGLGAAVVTAAGALLFRPRTQDEINELLKIEPLEIAPVASTPKAKTQKEAAQYLTKLMDQVLSKREALGEEVVNSIIPVFENLFEIIKQWPKLEGRAEAEYTVDRTLYEYLPDSLKAYINVSKNKRVEEEPALRAKLIEQMNILEAGTQKISDSLHEEDVRALETQSHFLEARFADSINKKTPSGLEL